MSDDSPRSLLDVLKDHTVDRDSYSNLAACSCGWQETGGPWWLTHPQHQTAAWVEASTISTLEQLDALPADTVIRWDRGRGVASQVLQRGTADWLEPGSDSTEPHGAHLLPAQLLWHPAWDAS